MRTSKRVAHFAAALMLVWAGFAGTSEEPRKAKPDFPAQEEQSKPAPSQLPDKEEIPPPAPGALFPAVVARVNGSPVLGRDLEQSIRSELAPLGNPPWENLRQEYRQELIGRHMTSLVGTELLYQNAKANAVEVTEPEIQAEFENVAKMYADDAELNTVLASRGMDREGLRKELEKSLVVTKFIREDIAQKVVVTPAEVSEYYKTHTDQFRHGNMVRTSHVLIRVPDNAAASQVQSARERAAAVLAKLEAGEDFATLAREYSMDPSASEGGDIGFAQQGELDPDYERAAFALEEGATSDLVRTAYGFHIIKVTERKKAGLATLADVQEQLTDYLKNSKSDEELDKLITQLREKAEIVFYIPILPPQNSGAPRQ